MHKTRDNHKQELIADLAAARRAIMQVVAVIPFERLDEVFLGEWSVKDLLAHLEGWDRTNLQAIQEILAGQPPTFFQYYDPDWRSYNQQLVETYLREPFVSLVEEVEASHRQLIAFLEALPAKDLVEGKVKRETGRSVTIRNLLRSETHDETRHYEQLKAYFFG